MRVTICVVTYRRPAGLARLLRGLGRLTFSRMPPPSLNVVVVDNDRQGSAAPVCAQLSGELPGPLEYHREPVRGIARARNRAVAAAIRTAEFLAFIDDDEVPEPRWLEELLLAQQQHAAGAVAGPVLPYFDSPAPDWILRGRFFERPRYATGVRLRHAGTCNVLVRAEVFRELGRAFDERLNLTGGEDTHFLLRATRAGHPLVWADEAVVHEWHPESRTDARWLLQRAYRSGNSWSLCEQDLDPSTAVRVVRLLKACARVTQGAVALPIALLLGRAALIRSLQCICSGVGSLTGLAGLRYEEYRATHGY